MSDDDWLTDRTAGSQSTGNAGGDGGTQKVIAPDPETKGKIRLRLTFEEETKSRNEKKPQCTLHVLRCLEHVFICA